MPGSPKSKVTDKETKSVTESKESSDQWSQFPEQTSTFLGYYNFSTAKNQVRILNKGFDLLISYYQLKYGTNILRPCDKTGDFVDASEFLAATTLSEIRKMRPAKGDFRCTFVLTLPGQLHNVCLTYIYENKQEALLYIDTRCTNDADVRDALQNFAIENKIPIYVSSQLLQKDHNSCGVMSLAFARDLTIKKDKKSYLYGSLLPALKNNAVLRDGLLYTTLPTYLIKSSQYPERLDEVMMDKSIVHFQKGENIAMFRKRYRQMIQGIERDSFAVVKGFKYQKLITILFYLEQVNTSFTKETGMSLSKEMQLLFVKNAKQCIKTMVNNADISNEQLMKKTGECLSPFSTQFLEEALANQATKNEIKSDKSSQKKGVFARLLGTKKTPLATLTQSKNISNDPILVDTATDQSQSDTSTPTVSPKPSGGKAA